MPVDLRLMLDDRSSVDTVWDGQSRWASFRFRTPSPPECAVLDPSNKIPLDTDCSNNSLLVHPFYAPVIEWAARVLGYFQNVLLLIGSVA